MAVQFFYDNQVRRFLLQFTRLISNFQVQFSTTDEATGNLALQTIPVYYGDGSRQAALILRNNSENMLNAVPAMSFYISSLQYDRTRVQDPSFVGKLHIRERKYDPATGMQTDQQGDTYTVERPMPVPYMMTIKLDVWTSNTEQKLQIFEQLVTLFNPALEIQSTDNYIDWTSLSYVMLDDVVWTSRSVPMGADDSIDIMTFTFQLPIFIAPPAKVTHMNVIQKVIGSVYDSVGQLDKEVFDENKILIRRTVTFLGYGVLLTGNRAKLVNRAEGVRTNDLTGTEIYDITQPKDVWRSVINQYGAITGGTSQLRLEQENGTELIGTVAYDPTDDTQLLFNVLNDTIPTNTLQAINAIIDPFKNNVIDLLYDNAGDYQVTVGTRYLVLSQIGNIESTEFAKAWAPNGIPVVASPNDIIQYDGTKWFVDFVAADHSDIEYVTNTNTNIQYKWTGEMWVKSYEGLYRESTWRLVL
jgi:hypothetical protein